MDNQKYIEYAQQLNEYIKFPTIVLSVLAVIFVVIFIVAIKLKFSKSCMMITTVIIAIVFCCAFYFEVYVYKIDIKNNDYIEYTGDFYVEDYYIGGRQINILIKTPENKKAVKYRINLDIEIDTNKSYNGSFIAGKNSKAIIYFSTEHSIK